MVIVISKTKWCQFGVFSLLAVLSLFCRINSSCRKHAPYMNESKLIRIVDVYIYTHCKTHHAIGTRIGSNVSCSFQVQY